MVEKTLPPSFSHLKKFKDLIPVEFSQNPDFSDNQFVQGGGVGDGFVSPFICLLTGSHVNGKTGFSVLLGCGHVFSSKGLASSQKTSASDNCCYVCQKQYEGSNILPLNPKESEKEVLIKSLLEFQKNEKLGKEKKRKNDGENLEGQVAKKKKYTMLK